MDTPGKEEAARQEFPAEGLELNVVSGSRYIGAYLGPQEEFAAWVKPQVEAWAHEVRVLGKIAQQHPQTACFSLGMLLQLEWKYLQSTDPIVGTLMCPIEEALREKFFPAIFGGEEINTDFLKILGHSVKHGSLNIQDLRISEESAYNTSKADSGKLVDSLLGGTALNYVCHKACVRRAIAGARRKKAVGDGGAG